MPCSNITRGIDKRIYKVTIVFFAILLFVLSGCSLQEIRQEIFRIYTVDDIQNAEQKYVKKFDSNREVIFDETLEILKKMQVEVIKKDIEKFLIVAIRFDRLFSFCIDTTPVGILINETGQNSSEVIVASGNYPLGKFVSEKIFDGLTKNSGKKI